MDGVMPDGVVVVLVVWGVRLSGWLTAAPGLCSLLRVGVCVYRGSVRATWLSAGQRPWLCSLSIDLRV